MQLLVAGILVERVHGPAEPLVLAFGRRAQRLARPEPRRLTERGAQLRESGRVQCDNELAAGLVPLLVDELEEGAERGAVQRVELPDEILDQDVTVTDLAEQRGEPLELGPEPLPLDTVVQLSPRRPEQRADPARRDPELVQIFGIVAAARPALPGEELGRVRTDERLELVFSPLGRLEPLKRMKSLCALGAHAGHGRGPFVRSRVGIYGLAGAAFALAVLLSVLGVGEEEGALTNWQALVLGVVQGATELLPISSSGHLILVPWLADWQVLQEDDEFNQTFDVALHLGTLVAVVGYFWRDVVRLLSAWVGSLSRRSVTSTDERVAWAVFVATIPAAVVGALGEEFIVDRLGEPWQIAILLAFFALILLVADRTPQRRNLETVGVKEGFAIGVAQGLALMPGVSRSGITISAARFLGFDRDSAARLSFLLLIPTTFGAVLWKGVTDVLLADLPDGWQGPFVVGILAALASGLLAIVFLLGFVRRHTYAPFVVYRVVVAVVVLGLIAAGVRDSAF